LLNPGDEVIIPAPYWVSYPSIVLSAEGGPVTAQTDSCNNFKLTPEQLATAITPKTKLLIINSPCNPTGMVYSAEELQALAGVLLKNPQVYIISDDIYEHICWTTKPYKNIVMQCPQLYRRTLVINGMSKAYSMTGWRIGYTGGPEEIIKAMKTLQSQNTSVPSSISQMAAKVALNGPQDCVSKMTAAFHQRQQLVLKKLKSITSLSCQTTQGAFYLFPNATKAIEKLGLKDDIEFSEYLLNEALVALVPGTAFGVPGHVRISYATNEEILTEALNRIAKIC